jgi:hypothetical protein
MIGTAIQWVPNHGMNSGGWCTMKPYVTTVAESIEEHDGVKYTTPESRMKIVQFIMKNPFFSLYILMDILIRAPKVADLCYRGQESEYYTALINKPPSEDTYDASITGVLIFVY